MSDIMDARVQQLEIIVASMLDEIMELKERLSKQEDYRDMNTATLMQQQATQLSLQNRQNQWNQLSRQAQQPMQADKLRGLRGGLATSVPSLFGNIKTDL